LNSFMGKFFSASIYFFGRLYFMNVYQTRMNEIKKELERQGAEAAFITAPLSVAYLTGFMCEPHERFMGLFIGENRAVLFVPSLEVSKAEEVLGAGGYVQQVIGVQDTEDPYVKMTQVKGIGAVKRLSVEKDYMKLSQFERLTAVFPDVQVTDMGGFIAHVRNKKSPEEVARLKAAARLVDEVLAEGLKRVKIGVSEAELVAELEYIMKRKGAAPSFETMVLAGANSALPHGVPGERAVREGEFLLFDLGVFKDGYCSDITRTFVVGEPSVEMEKIYGTVLAAEEAAIEAVRVGRALAEVDLTARRIIEEAGYGEYFTHRIGHGLGMEVHEYPSVHSKNEEKMEAGMVFTIEPGIYVPGLGGVRIEDDIHVTENGAEVLTSFPKTLTCL
jgi:Xaa-Pro dipeptidase